ncbi:rap guanine nucleotide exchange factor 6 [Etheostoma spectabile]|uniref:rap guanine nucleotide exchange factor 6 n=1 Tax=Etheostoma spectabile TaxID=54343 RepID=UPI0013AFE66D|nr:rap guanine nucleotide exchange factor 6-like [Etheostoma spectabile]
MKMTGAMETSFKLALKKPPSLRTAEDLHTIYSHLYHMDVLSHLREHQLRSMCTSARYERHEANHVLFYPDSIATCWYILLSGSVFVKEHMYLTSAALANNWGADEAVNASLWSRQK